MRGSAHFRFSSCSKRPARGGTMCFFHPQFPTSCRLFPGCKSSREPSAAVWHLHSPTASSANCLQTPPHWLWISLSQRHRGRFTDVTCLTAVNRYCRKKLRVTRCPPVAEQFLFLCVCGGTPPLSETALRPAMNSIERERGKSLVHCRGEVCRHKCQTARVKTNQTSCYFCHILMFPSLVFLPEKVSPPFYLFIQFLFFTVHRMNHCVYSRAKTINWSAENSSAGILI